MRLIDWAQDRSESMTLGDIGVLKVTATLFGILVGAYLASFVTRNVWWFVAVLVVLGSRSGYRWFAAPSARLTATRSSAQYPA